MQHTPQGFEQKEEDFERQHQLQSEGMTFEHVVNRVAELLAVSPDQVLAGGKHKETVAASSLLCFWATTEVAINQVELGQKLKISQPVVSMAVRRGERLASRNDYCKNTCPYELFHECPSAK